MPIPPFTRTNAAKVVQPRSSHAHKGTNGRVVIVAGNDRFGGAAIMSATAAVYAGAGLVTVATAAKNHAPLHARLPETMVTTWDDAALPLLLHDADVIVVGPGLGTDTAAAGVLTLVLAAVHPTTTLIVDGSAITILAGRTQPLTHTRTIWTPHPGELARLTGLPVTDQTDAAVQRATAELPGILVAKGAPTRVFAQSASWRNTSGSPAMATGGSGDTLTGVIAAFCAQFGDAPETVAAAVWTHSTAADVIARTQYVAVPSDVAHQLPILMRELADE